MKPQVTTHPYTRQFFPRRRRAVKTPLYKRPVHDEQWIVRVDKEMSCADIWKELRVLPRWPVSYNDHVNIRKKDVFIYQLNIHGFALADRQTQGDCVVLTIKRKPSS